MTLNVLQHKEYLIKILKDIYDDNILSTSLGFKGGTAAMLLYGLNRFSVDLDFDLLILKNENIVWQKINHILEKYGTIKESKRKKQGMLFLLSYHNKSKDAQNIKIEINFRNFGSSFEIKDFLGIAMQVMVQSDMTANKLVAMYERIGKTNRDIYDVWFFLKNEWPINKEIIVHRTELEYPIFLQKCIEALEEMADKYILDGLGELLNGEQKIWAKAHLKKETIFLLKLELFKAQEAAKQK